MPAAQLTVGAVWYRYYEAFTSKNLAKVMACYDESSHVRLFNNLDGKKGDFKGLMQVQRMYEEMFSHLTDLSTFQAPVIDIDEDAGQVFLCWKCSSSGYLSATSTFLYSRNYMIWKQNIVVTKVPGGTQVQAQRSTASVPLGTQGASATQGTYSAPAPPRARSPPRVASATQGTYSATAPPRSPSPPYRTGRASGDVSGSVHLQPWPLQLPPINISPTVSSVNYQEPIPVSQMSSEQLAEVATSIGRAGALEVLIGGRP